jgi:predicted metal-dependent phosphoesterase TrpH
MAVDRHVGEIVEQLGRAVLALHLREQFRRRVDELRRVGIVLEDG